MRNRYTIILFVLISLFMIGCDRVTKQMARDHLMNAPEISYFHNTFVLEYAENTGAALSLGDNLPKAASLILLSIVPLGLMVWLVVYFLRNLPSMTVLKTASLALIFSGGLGNIIDRIFSDRHVTDFMNVGIGSLRTGIFNVADMALPAE